MASIIPTVIEKTRSGDYAYDLYSRLLKDRIVFVFGEVNSHLAEIIIAQLLFLEKEDPTAEVQMYISSGGGSIYSGNAILDTMKFVSYDIKTIAVGICASYATVLLSNGTKGKRYSLPHSTIHIHQPISYGGEGSQQASDLVIEAEEVMRLKKQLYSVLARNTGQSLETIEQNADRDKYFDANQALEFGFIDKILKVK